MDKKQFGNFVAENRKELGLTQKMLSDRLHVTDKAVSKWERGLSYPDVTLLEPLSEVFGMDVTELVTCRRKKSAGAQPPEAPEHTPDAETASGVRDVLDISRELLGRERARRKRWMILLTAILLAVCVAVGVLWSRKDVTESGSLSVIHREERENDLALFIEKDGHLLCLTYGPAADLDELKEQIDEGCSLRAEYRWDRKSMQGKLLRWEKDRLTIGGPMDEVGASTDLYAFDGDALFGCPRVMVKTLSRRPNPRGAGYLSDYIFYRGDDSDDWYLHADEELLRVTGCLGYGEYGDGGFWTSDTDGDGVRELLIRTAWPEKPCIVYDRTENGIVETWLDEIPAE